MSMLSNLDLIRRVPLFSMLTADQAQAIADAWSSAAFARGELVVEQGRKSNALFILLNGRARVLTADTRGREVILAVLEAGRLRRRDEPDRQRAAFGHGARRGADRHAGAGARRLRALPAGELAPCPTASCAAWCSACATPTARSNRWRCSTCTAAWRARCSTWPRRSTACKIIRHKVSRQDMAKVVGASREMVSRVMKDLEERGVIETQENGSVIIKERPAERLSCGRARPRRWRRNRAA